MGNGIHWEHAASIIIPAFTTFQTAWIVSCQTGGISYCFTGGWTIEVVFLGTISLNYPGLGKRLGVLKGELDLNWPAGRLLKNSWANLGDTLEDAKW